MSYIRCRIACELHQEDRTFRGIVVNVSSDGLFVQTSNTFGVGSGLRVRIFPKGNRAPFEIETRVARVKRVHPGAQAVVARGMGLEVTGDCGAWRELTTELGCRNQDAVPVAPRGDPTFGLPHFRIVLRRKDGIRIQTRVVHVASLDAKSARDGALADLDDGWELVKVERESTRIEGHANSQHPYRVVALHEKSQRRWESVFEAISGIEARKLAEADLGPHFRIEDVESAVNDERATTHTHGVAAPEAPQPPVAASPLEAPAPSIETETPIPEEKLPTPEQQARDPRAEPQFPLAPPNPAGEAASAPRRRARRVERIYQVQARLQDGAQIRTRMAKVRATSPEAATQALLAQLGDGWKAVKVTLI